MVAGTIWLLVSVSSVYWWAAEAEGARDDAQRRACLEVGASVLGAGGEVGSDAPSELVALRRAAGDGLRLTATFGNGFVQARLTDPLRVVRKVEARIGGVLLPHTEQDALRFPLSAHDAPIVLRALAAKCRPGAVLSELTLTPTAPSLPPPPDPKAAAMRIAPPRAAAPPVVAPPREQPFAWWWWAVAGLAAAGLGAAVVGEVD